MSEKCSQRFSSNVQEFSSAWSRRGQRRNHHRSRSPGKLRFLSRGLITAKGAGAQPLQDRIIEPGRTGPSSAWDRSGGQAALLVSGWHHSGRAKPRMNDEANESPRTGLHLAHLRQGKRPATASRRNQSFGSFSSAARRFKVIGSTIGPSKKVGPIVADWL